MFKKSLLIGGIVGGAVAFHEPILGLLLGIIIAVVTWVYLALCKVAEGVAEEHQRQRENNYLRTQNAGGYAVYQIINRRTMEVYTGMTRDPGKRRNQHFNKSHNRGVRQMVLTEGTAFEVLENKLTHEDASILERQYVKESRQFGWVVHNDML